MQTNMCKFILASRTQIFDFGGILNPFKITVTNKNDQIRSDTSISAETVS
jgi:hypothetical protein